MKKIFFTIATLILTPNTFADTTVRSEYSEFVINNTSFLMGLQNDEEGNNALLNNYDNMNQRVKPPTRNVDFSEGQFL
jgi:hypothetical protein